MILADGGFGGWLIHAFPDISSNLIAAAIGGMVVWLATRTAKRLKLIRARRFWRAMGSRRPFIVLGAPDRESLTRWEKSGMVGKGDILALVEIEDQLRRLNFSGKIVEAKELTAEDLQSDLILIGGPDGNSATATMLGELDGVISYHFVDVKGDDASPLHDKRSGRQVAPQNNKSGDPTNDYGLIVRAPNPLAPESAEIVIVAGCWGYGTAAAAKKLSDQKFLRKQRRSKHFEAVVETTVIRGAYFNTKVQDTREITYAIVE